MRPAATRPPIASTLYLAFELGNSEWKLAMTTSIDRAPLLRTIPARAVKILETEIERARVHFGLPATAEAQSCYEAGRDGFWLHRYLVSRGIGNSIVDSSSIEVNRRRRRTKTDRLDACKLVTMLMRAEAGEKKVWSVVRVPTMAEEDRRQVHRELLFAKRDRGRHTNRIKRLLANHGVPLQKLHELPTHLATARLWDGSPLPPLLSARLEREWATVGDYTTRIRALKQERRDLLKTTDDLRLRRYGSSTSSAASGSTAPGSTSWSSSPGASSGIVGKRAASPGSPTRITRAAISSTNKGSRKRGIGGSGPLPSTRPGRGSAFSPRASLRAGIRRNSGMGTAACGKSGSSLWRGSS